MLTQAQLPPLNPSGPTWAVEYITSEAEVQHSASGVPYYQVPNVERIVGVQLREFVEAFNQAERERLNAVEYRREANRFWLFGSVGVVAVAGLGYYLWKKRR